MRGAIALSESNFETRRRALDFVRWTLCQAFCQGIDEAAVDMFQRKYPHRREALGMVRKAAVAAGTTTGWGDDLSPQSQEGAAFAELVRPRTILGRMTGARRVPFRITIPKQTVGASVSWVGEGKPTPLSALAFDQLALDAWKLSGIVAISKELARSSDPAAENLVLNDLVAAVAQMVDLSLIDPSRAGSAGVSPAAITYDAETFDGGGGTLDDLIGALRQAVAHVGSTNLIAPVWVMDTATAVFLATSGTNIISPGFGINGGDLMGIPVITTTAVPTTLDESSPAVTQHQIALVDQADILLADGAVELDQSSEAIVEMETAPDDPSDAGTVMVSLWQRNLIGLKALKFANWTLRRDDAVAVVNNVTL